MEFKAALFDMDGTLVDSERVYATSLRLALAEIDVEISDRTSLELIYGRAWSDAYADLIQHFPKAAVGEAELDNMLAKHFDAIERQQPNAFVIDGSSETLKKLSDEMPIAVVSGSPRQHLAKFTKVLEIEEHIQFYLGSEDYPEGKPSPIPYLCAAEKLGVEPSDCIVFEDSTVGIHAAKAAGMYCVGIKIPGGVAQDTSRADVVVENLHHWYTNR